MQVCVFLKQFDHWWLNFYTQENTQSDLDLARWKDLDLDVNPKSGIAISLVTGMVKRTENQIDHFASLLK